MYFTSGSDRAFEQLMQGKPGFDHYDSGEAVTPEDCGTCRFYRPHWKYQFCVYAECPYQPGKLTAYDAVTFRVNGVENIISYQGPSCTGFDCTSGQAKPVFEKYETPFSASYVTTQLQTAALQYVKDMVSIFGNDLKRVYARGMDASWPMEYFLHYPRPLDASLFDAIPFEDDMGVGRVTIRDIWQESLNAIVSHNSQGDGWDDRLN